MERLFCLPADSDFALQLHILPGKLLKHSVNCSRKRLEFVRSAVCCNAVREVTFDDGGRSAADIIHVIKERTMTQPAYVLPEQQHKADRGADSMPETLDKGLGASPLATDQQVDSS